MKLKSSAPIRGAVLASTLPDTAFATGFLLFSQALLTRLRPNWVLGLRIAIWAISILICSFAVMRDIVPLELVSSDFGCFLLISIPLGQPKMAVTYLNYVLEAAKGSSKPLIFSGAMCFACVLKRPCSCRACIAICSTSQGDALCKGCGRTFAEVQHWPEMSPADKRATWRRITAEGTAWRFNRYAERAQERAAQAPLNPPTSAA